MGLALAAQEVFTAPRFQSEGLRQPERLLVVDDEPMASRLISARLKQSGFQVETVASGVEAMEIISARNFDLILLDRLMPGWTGDRVLKELRRFHSQTELPIIMVSAIDDSAGVSDALDLGANDYITKPIDFTLALARIRSQLFRKRSEGTSGTSRDSLEPKSHGDGLWDWNLESNRIYFCPRWRGMLGLSAAEVMNEPSAWFSRVHPQDVDALDDAIHAHWAGQTETFQMDYRIRCHDRSYRLMAARGVAFRDADGKAVRMVGSQSDLTDAKTPDVLSGFVDRSCFAERLAAALERKRLNPATGRGLAVLAIHLERFQLLNDDGPAGDDLLLEFGLRIEAIVLKWSLGMEDRQRSVVGHFGGDQFAVVLDGISSPLQAVSVADEVLRTMQQYREFAGTACIGITISEPRCGAAGKMLQDAETAMRSAQAQDRNCWVVFREQGMS